MQLGERDPYTGLHTTGHEWSGITELNTPIPWAVKFFYALTFKIVTCVGCFFLRKIHCDNIAFLGIHGASTLNAGA